MSFTFQKAFFEEFFENTPPNRNSDETLYDVLQVSPSVSPKRLRDSYHRLVKIHHPDKGGEISKIQKINLAYETLSDPEKKRNYDRYSQDLLKGNYMQFGNNSNLIDLLLKGKKEKPSIGKVRPIVKNIRIDLEEAYKGKKICVYIERRTICRGCNGKGGSYVDECGKCDSRRFVAKSVKLNNGVLIQKQVKCKFCFGKGKIKMKKKFCGKCKSKKYIINKERVVISVPAGVRCQQRIIVEDVGNERKGFLTGALIIVISIRPHLSFRIFQNNLFLEYSISPEESKNGFSFNLKHIDGSFITLYTSSGDCVGDEERRVVRGLGFPLNRNNEVFGDLIVLFRVNTDIKERERIEIEGRRYQLEKIKQEEKDKKENTGSKQRNECDFM